MFLFITTTIDDITAGLASNQKSLLENTPARPCLQYALPPLDATKSSKVGFQILANICIPFPSKRNAIYSLMQNAFLSDVRQNYWRFEQRRGEFTEV